MKQGIVEQVPEQPTGERKFYLPHKPVIKESAETTRVHSAKENSNVPSLNECLHKGPPLQPLLYNVLVRIWLKPIGLTADIRQAIHQICRAGLTFRGNRSIFSAWGPYNPPPPPPPGRSEFQNSLKSERLKNINMYTMMWKIACILKQERIYINLNCHSPV
jgi:hypothetical protein